MPRGRIILPVAGALLIVWLAARRLRPFRVVVEGESMVPALNPGDQLIAVRPGRIRRGDLVVVRPPGYELEMVKRVAAVPGDEADTGQLEPGMYLVLGDNPARSTDGRAFGPVPASAITGVVRFRYLPRPGPVG